MPLGMLLNLNLNARSIMHVRFFLRLKSLLCMVLWFVRCMNQELQQKTIRLGFRKALFPYVTKFMDKRLDCYLSLFYECECYTAEELNDDLCEILYNKQCFSVSVPQSVRLPKPLPVYQQLSLF